MAGFSSRSCSHERSFRTAIPISYGGSRSTGLATRRTTTEDQTAKCDPCGLRVTSNDSLIVGKAELPGERRTFANLVRSSLDDFLAGGDLTSDGNVLADRRSLSHVYPVCSTID